MCLMYLRVEKMRVDSGIIALSMLVLITVVPLVIAAAPGNEIYFIPQQHSNASYCNTTDVQIWANTTDTFGGGQINLTYTSSCANATNWVYGSLWQGTWDSRVDGKEWLVFIRPFGQPTVNGNLLIGTLTIHCCSESECETPLTFSLPSKLTDPVAGDLTATWINGVFTCSTPKVDYYFDTGKGTYPSIMGTHTGTITPNKKIAVHKMYTYPCAGTGGHTEYVRFNGNGLDVNETWNGYIGDYHYILFDPPITLHANITYNYEIRTGSYPQIIHEQSLPTANGTINCTQFTDANGRTYDNGIPAIRLE